MAREPFASYALLLHPADDVAVARRAIPAGCELAGPAFAVTIRNPIAPGQKFAVRAPSAGTAVRKYGQPIGVATADIAPVTMCTCTTSAWLSSTAIIRSARRRGRCRPCRPRPVTFDRRPSPRRPGGHAEHRRDPLHRELLGHGVPDAERLRRRAARVPPHGRRGGRSRHKGGCGEMGGAHDLAPAHPRRGADHPNVGADVVVGSGCEVNHTVEPGAEPRA